MKLNKMGRVALASMLSLAIGLGVTACSRDYTLAYAYATTAKPLASGSNNGGVSAYAVDYQSGSLTPLADSPVTAGRNPVALVAAPDGLTLYVVNQDDSSVMQFSIGTDGKLYLKNTVNVTGSLPTAVAIDAQGKFLYVTFTYQLGPNGQQLYSPASPGPGGVTIFPINSDGSLGTASTVNLGNNPVGIVVSRPVGTPSVAYVYVVDQEKPANSSPFGVVLGFLQDQNTGALTPTPGTVITTVAGKTVATGYGAGTTPSAITEDPSSRFVYVTDEATNQLYGNLVGSGGALVAMTNGPFNTGQFPVGLTIDPRGKYLYVANYSSQSIGAYVIDTATGTPVGSVGSATTAVPAGPTCVTVDPALGIYLYSSNNLDNSVSGLQLNPHNGGLTQVQNTPFPSSGLPTCVTTVANGSHPTQIINP
jgi:6-phosphogluconolactonase